MWLGGTAEEFYLAAERGLLVSYQPEEAYAIPAEFRQNNWLWTALYIDHIGFLSNKKNLHYLGLYAPESWQELLAEPLKYELALAELIGVVRRKEDLVCLQRPAHRLFVKGHRVQPGIHAGQVTESLCLIGHLDGSAVEDIQKVFPHQIFLY